MIRSITKNNNFNEKFPFNTIFSHFKSENLPTQLKIRDESAQRLGKRSAPIRVDLDEILPKFSGEMSAFKVVILCQVRPRSRQRPRLHRRGLSQESVVATTVSQKKNLPTQQISLPWRERYLLCGLFYRTLVRYMQRHDGRDGCVDDQLVDTSTRQYKQIHG